MIRKTLTAVLTGAAVLTGIASAHASTGSHVVVYEAWADQSNSASTVTYFGGDDTILQDSDVALPWSKVVNNDSTYPSYGMNVQNNGTGNISCRITVDGVVKDTESARGRYAIADCNAD